MDLKTFSKKDDPYAPHRKKDPPLYDTRTKAEIESEEQKDTSMNEGDVRAAIGHYSKLSNEQLMGELIKQVTAKKAKGDTKNMKETIERIKPLLNAEQRKRLEVIVGQLDL